MKRLYITPEVEACFIPMEPLCQSIGNYQIGGDTYDDDSD